MPQKLVMTLSPAATEKYLAIMSKQTEAEVNADCEPSGAIIQVTFDHIFSSADLVTGSGYIDLGNVDVELVDCNFSSD